MDKKVLNQYLNIRKQLKTTKKILEKLKAKPKQVIDFAKDYSKGYPHNITIEGYDVITDFKIKMYKEKEEELIEEEKEALVELTKIIDNIKDPMAKAIFEYRYIADMRFEEIAMKVNNSYDNVRAIHYRTIKKLSQNVTK